MREKINNSILEIAAKLEKGVFDETGAKKALCKLFDIKYKPQVKGRATVKTRDGGQGWRYEGDTLDIIELYMTHNNGYGVYPDGTREFRLNLIGTKHEKETGYKNTVIPEVDLEILDLEII